MKPQFPSSGSRRCATSAETTQLGWEMGAALEAGDVVILDGPLGAGKTTLTQGIAQGMDVEGRVTSPTFIIAREHRSRSGGPSLIHVDAYRLIGEDSNGDPLGDLDSLDLDTELDNAVVVAEWGSGLVEQITSTYLYVRLNREAVVEADPFAEARDISWEIRTP